MVRPRSASRAAGAALLVAALVSACRGPEPAPEPGADGPVTVTFPNAGPSDRPLFIYSGMRDGACRKNEMHVGTPNVVLGDVTIASTCPIEGDAFTVGFGAYGRRLLQSVSADVAWVQAGMSSRTYDISLPTVRDVPVTLWIVARPADQAFVKEMADNQVSHANPFLEDRGTGLKVHDVAKYLSPGAVPPDCDQAGAIAANPAVYDALRINVYFVANYLNVEYSSYAIDCWMEGHPEIAFVSWANEYTPVVSLVHELGHALGLVRPLDVGGHTNGVPGFDAFNLMVSGAADVTNVSVGQTYRLSFDALSWFNRPAAPAPSPVVRTCQADWGPGACPALTLFRVGWPP